MALRLITITFKKIKKMKKLIVAFAILISSLSFAQSGDKKQRLTPEQNIEKRLKVMTNELNLSEKQQGEVKVIMLEQSKKREAKRVEMKAAREKGETISDEQKAEMKKGMIDEQLEMKTKLKKILSTEQLKKMKETRKARGKEIVGKRRDGKKRVEKNIEQK